MKIQQSLFAANFFRNINLAFCLPASGPKSKQPSRGKSFIRHNLLPQVLTLPFRVGPREAGSQGILRASDDSPGRVLTAHIQSLICPEQPGKLNSSSHAIALSSDSQVQGNHVELNLWRDLGWLLVFVLLSSLLTPSTLFAEEPISGKPNIVFVLVDDHAFEAVSAYGSHLKDFARTPTIDRLAEEGMRFDNFVCANSICSPSRASFITGQYSHVNGVKNLNGEINADSPWLSEELQKGGYETLLVGKWHLKGTIRGFDKHMTVKGQGKYFDPKFYGSEGTWSRKGYSTDVYTDIALDWLKSRDKNKPFFLSLQFKAPHHEFGHAARYDDLLAGVEIPEPDTLYEDTHNSNSMLKRQFMEQTKFHMTRGVWKGRAEGYYDRHLKDSAPNEMWKHDPENDRDKIRVAYQHMLHKYIRCIQGNDDNLRRVLEFLDGEQLTENTIVIYTSDQGYWLGQHGMYDKRLILETSIRMPFLIRYPKMIKPATENTSVCINVDLAPTLLDIAGLAVPPKMQGRSFAEMLSGENEPTSWRKSSLYSYWSIGPKHYGIRTKRYTYLKINEHAELFDRLRDHDQLNNVADLPEYASVLEECEKELQQQIADTQFDQSDWPRN